MRSRPILVLFLSGACLYGCRKAKIDAPTVLPEPAVNVGALPERKVSTRDSAWYRDLMPTAAEPVAEKDTAKDKVEDPKPKVPDQDRPWVPLDTPVEASKPERVAALRPSVPPVTPASARADAQVLIDELRARIEVERKGSPVWSLLRLDLQSSGSEKGRTLVLLADIGLSSLYAARPEILFEQLRFEDCMNRLARMAGLRYAQRERWGNPLVTWRGENVSVYDAIQAISSQHGFAARYVAAGTRFTFPLAKYQTREQFIEEVTSAVREQGKQMERGLPTLLISTKTTGSDSTEEAKGNSKKAKELTKESPENIKP